MKTVTRYTLAALLAVGLTACATPKQWAAAGGSRADGVVRLVFNYGGFEKPVVDEAQAVATAAGKCRVWGYTGAEAFGAALYECKARGGLGTCTATQVTKEYQCTGLGDSRDAAGAP